MRFVTLTRAANDAGLRERCDSITTAFRRLREQPAWKDYVTGGVAVIEVTLGKDRHWHVHLHVLVCGDFLPQAKLKAAWLAVTGDSYIVDVRAVHDRRHAAKYVGEYVAKPPAYHTLTDEEIREFATAMHGRRMLTTFGCARKEINEEDDVPDTREPSVFLCNVSTLHRRMVRGCEHTIRATEILSRLPGMMHRVFGKSQPDECTETPNIKQVAYAVGVCEVLEKSSPDVPHRATLDAMFREMCGLPEPPKASRVEQLRFCTSSCYGAW